MNAQKAKITLAQAEELYDAAQEGQAKPEEDVVTYAVCRNAFKAVHKYLVAFLLENDFEIHSTMSLEVMMDKCTELEPAFLQIDLAPMYSTSLDEDVWMDLETMNEYLTIAKKTREMVTQRLKVAL